MIISMRIFLSNFFPIFFFQTFCQNFPQNFFGICFEGFARETHACFEHPMRDFSRDYMNENFFVKFYIQILRKFFGENFDKKI